MRGGMKKSTLLVATIVFWVLQLIRPILNGHFPYVRVTQNDSLSAGNALTLAFGFLSFLAARHLREKIAPILEWASFCRDTAHLFLSFLTVTGHGAHMVCVVLEDASSYVHPGVEPLLYFLHERVSHNAFQLGFLGTLALLAWEEVGAAIATTMAAAHVQPPPNLKAHVSGVRFALPRFAGAALVVLGCCLLGAFFSIFATETYTHHVTVAFYILVLTAGAVGVRSLGVREVWRRFARSDMLVCGAMAQAALAGLVVMAVY